METDLYQNTLSILPVKERLKIAKQIRQKQVENYVKFMTSVDPDNQKENRKKTRVKFSPNYQVQDAIENCDDLQVLKLAKGGFDPNFTTGNGVSLLHKCCSEGNIVVADVLVSMGADVNVQDDDWWTPLHVACHRDNSELVQFLLNNESDVTLLDVDGNFAVDHAPARSESYNIMWSYLNEQGFEGKVVTEKRINASRLVKLEIEGFIDHGVNVSKPLFDGITWLHIVCANGYKKGLKLLLDNKADVNVVDLNGWTPLHVAAKFRQKQVVEILLKNQARTDITGIHGFRPIDVAASEDIQQIILEDQRKRRLSSVTSEDQFEDVEEEEAYVSKAVRPPELPLSKAEKLMEAQMRIQFLEKDNKAKADRKSDEFSDFVATILKVRESQEISLPSTGPSDDLTNFAEISDKLILDTIAERYKFKKIYTNIGDILIAVNPLQDLPYYSKEVCQMYHREAHLRHQPPHIYAVAEHCLREMKASQRSQCCVIGGESGSGKTESCKFLVQHLISVSDCVDSQLSYKINQINPLLEAFGNSHTLMNDNSSRYAKYLQLHYCSTGQILQGASLNEYLLEKSRVVSQGVNEFNFHIFYWMLAGLTPEECRTSFIDKRKPYRYLGNDITKMTEYMTLDNKQKFWEVKECLKFIGFTQGDINSVVAVLAAILHLGNITFGKKDDDSAVVTNEEPLKKVSNLLRIPFTDLMSALVEDSIITRGEQTILFLTENQSIDSCDGLAKCLYSRLFSWIVNGINMMVQPEQDASDKKLSVSILDLFGFENLEKNSFEQMCINLANEQLQIYFNEEVFKHEQDDCLSEGISPLIGALPLNDLLISMFMVRGGILTLLDEECGFPKATDKSLAHKLHHGPGQNYKRVYKSPKDGGTTFTAIHYAGAITYSLEGILEKNRDRLRPYLMTTMRSSSNLLFRDLFNTRLSKLGSLKPCVRQASMKISSRVLSKFNPAKRIFRVKGDKAAKPFTKKPPATMAYHFRNSLKDLMNKINQSKSHFIRCIKPNPEKKPSIFMSQYVQIQLKYTGILETTQIRKNGFSLRIIFREFLERYKCLHGVENPLRKKSDTELICCKKILERWKIGNYQIGKTRIFLQHASSERLDVAETYFLRMILKAQAVIRGYVTRKIMINRYSIRDRNLSHIEVFTNLIERNQEKLYQYQVDLTRHDLITADKLRNKDVEETLKFLDDAIQEEVEYVNLPKANQSQERIESIYELVSDIDSDRPTSEFISEVSFDSHANSAFTTTNITRRQDYHKSGLSIVSDDTNDTRPLSEVSSNFSTSVNYAELTRHYEVPVNPAEIVADDDSMNSRASHDSSYEIMEHPRNFPPSPREMYNNTYYEDMTKHNGNSHRSMERIPPVLPPRSPDTRLSNSTGTSSRGSSISEPDLGQGMYPDSHYSTPSPPMSPAKKNSHHLQHQYGTSGTQAFSYVPNAAVLQQHHHQHQHKHSAQTDYTNGARDDNTYASYIQNDDNVHPSYNGQNPKHMQIGKSVKKMGSPVLNHKKFHGPNGTSGSPKLRRASEGQADVQQGQKPKGKNVGSPKLPLKFHQKSMSVDAQSGVPPPPNFPAPPPPLHVQDRYLAGTNSTRCPSPPLPPPPPECHMGSTATPVKPPNNAPPPPPVSTIPGRQPRPTGQEKNENRIHRSHSRSNSSVESAAMIQELGTIRLKTRNPSSGSNGSSSSSVVDNNDGNELGKIQLKKTKTDKIGNIYQSVIPTPAATTSNLTAGMIPICDIDDFPLPPPPEELLSVAPAVIPPVQQTPIAKPEPKSPVVKHTPPVPSLPKSSYVSPPYVSPKSPVVTQAPAAPPKSPMVTQAPTTPKSPMVTHSPILPNSPVLDSANGHSKETTNANMDFEIPADIDLSECQGLVPYPKHCPVWKKEMIDKKNKDRVEEYVHDILREREEMKKWKNVPEWKRKILKQKADEDRAKEKSGKPAAPLPSSNQATTQEELLHAGLSRQDSDFVPAAMNIDPEEFENMPPWKQELLTKRKNIPVTFNNEYNPDEPEEPAAQNYDLDVKMAS